ncbi:hypothetical protein HQ533_02930 [Candidatus Woesearchaeota archaeon]|nr:hypothetical protein [Candidatus Woesearchaeota archaeon]
MFVDIVFPKGNEKEFIEKARVLGSSGIIFLYEKDDKKIFEKVKKLNPKNFKVYTGIVGKISKKYDHVFSKGSRQDFENKNVDIVFDLEKNPRKDSFHFRSSGLNQVLCSLAKENKIFVGFSFNSVLKAKDKGLVLGRMVQNVSLCKKYKVKMILASFASKPSELRYWKDLVSFGVTIGMNPEEAKVAVMNRKV